jgi:hypothetical protein
MKRVQKSIYLPVHLDDLIEEHMRQLLKEQSIDLSYNRMLIHIVREYMKRTEYANEINIPAPAPVAEWLYWTLGPVIKAGDYKSELKQPLQQWFKRFQNRVEGIMFGEDIL